MVGVLSGEGGVIRVWEFVGDPAAASHRSKFASEAMPRIVQLPPLANAAKSRAPHSV
jgi:hypothetical protein